MLTPLRSDLEAIGKERLEALRWILAQTSLVQTNTMNKVLTVNPITVITKFTPEDIILQKPFSPQLKISLLHQSKLKFFPMKTVSTIQQCLLLPTKIVLTLAASTSEGIPIPSTPKPKRNLIPMMNHFKKTLEPNWGKAKRG